MTKTGDLFDELAAVPPPAEQEKGARDGTDLVAERDLEPEEKRMDRRWLAAGLLLGAVIFFAGSIWYAFKSGQRSGMQIVVPVIKAESAPAKQKPETPGGMNPPHQDKLIFDRVDPGQSEAREEKLRPEPEKPLESAMAPPPKPQPAPEPEAPAPAPLIPQTGESKPGEGVSEETQVAESEPPMGPPPVWSEPTVAEAPAAQASPTPDVAQQDLPPAAGAASAPTAPAAAPTAAAPAPQEIPEQLALAEPAAGTATPSGGFRVQVASFRSEESADKEWNRLLRRHRDLLGSVKHIIDRADLGAERGVFYRVQIGPFPDRAAASDLCAKLRAREASCIVVKGS